MLHNSLDLMTGFCNTSAPGTETLMMVPAAFWLYPQKPSFPSAKVFAKSTAATWSSPSTGKVLGICYDQLVPKSITHQVLWLAEEYVTQNAKFLRAQKTFPQGWRGDATCSGDQPCQMIFQLPNNPVWKSALWEAFTWSVVHSCKTTPITSTPLSSCGWPTNICNFWSTWGQNDRRLLRRWRSWSLVFATSLPTSLFCVRGNRTNALLSRPLQNCKITLQNLLQAFAKLVSRCQSLDSELIPKFLQIVCNFNNF